MTGSNFTFDLSKQQITKNPDKFIKSTEYSLGFNERDLLLQAYRNVTLSGARYHIVNFLFVFCIFGIWLYAAIRPRFGAGPKTAVIAGLALWFVLLLIAVNFVNMGIFPIKLTLIALVFTLIELPIAILAGASIYKEESSTT